MSDDRAGANAEGSSGGSGSVDADWPVGLRGVTESVVTTLGPNDRWNVAALGLHVPDTGSERDDADEGGPNGTDAGRVTARTWGDTRTRRNFHREGGGVVQFTRDPVAFVDAALSIREVDEPVLDEADAWVEVDVEQVDAGESGGTRWEEWVLRPEESGVERETVPTINRGVNAVVEATVAASRLGVEAYDDDRLRERLAYFEDVAGRCGDERVERAMARLREYVDA